MFIDNVKRIITEEYPAENQILIQKLAFTLNNFMIEVVDAINGNIGIENLTQEIKVIDIQVDATGNPTISNKFNTKFASIKGIMTLSVSNLTNTSNYVKNTPFVSFSQKANIITLNNITGLEVSNKYRLTLLLVS